MSKMSAENLEELIDAMESEGSFDYAMAEYSSWKEIDDVRFQNLLSSYNKSRDNLRTYLRELADEYGIDRTDEI